MALLPVDANDAELKEYREHLLETSPYKELRMKDPRFRLDEEHWIRESEEQFRRLRAKQRRSAVMAKGTNAAKGTGMHLFRLGAAIIALVLAMLIGRTVVELLLVGNLMLSPLYAPLGGAIGMILWVPLWYWVIRRGKPVWQPGRRFWARWSGSKCCSVLRQCWTSQRLWSSGWRSTQSFS